MGSLPTRLAAVLLTALALVPVGAHLLELPNKIGLDEASYLTVQGIYRGWALLGLVLIGALLANLVMALLLRHRPWPFRLALAAALLMALTLCIFFAWTFPANQATANWTVLPQGWAELRSRWEYSHAANAVLTFLALVASCLASLLAGERP